MEKLKYYIMIEWPSPCRNRSEVTLKARPDLVHKINEFTARVIDICKKYKKPIQVDQNYNMVGIKTWWADGEELYHFLMNQDENIRSMLDIVKKKRDFCIKDKEE
jgi:hypothetical protein